MVHEPVLAQPEALPMNLALDAGLEICGLNKTFPGKREYVALENIDLQINRGEFVSLIGHSGCGKSTLLSILAGLEQPSVGTVKLDGQVISKPGPDRAVVFQNYSLLPWMTVEQNVSEAVEASCPNLDGHVLTGRVQTFLRAVGLWAHRNKRPHEISGGMKQRVAIARAFAIHPRVLLLDEPFGALDALTRSGLQDKLNELWQGGVKGQLELERPEVASASAIETVVMVTHDIDEAIYLSDKIVVMTNGPRAGIQEVIEVPFARPRSRQIVQSSQYARLREHLVHLLTEVLAVKEH